MFFQKEHRNLSLMMSNSRHFHPICYWDSTYVISKILEYLNKISWFKKLFEKWKWVMKHLHSLALTIKIDKHSHLLCDTIVLLVNIWSDMRLPNSTKCVTQNQRLNCIWTGRFNRWSLVFAFYMSQWNW